MYDKKERERERASNTYTLYGMLFGALVLIAIKLSFWIGLLVLIYLGINHLLGG